MPKMPKPVKVNRQIVNLRTWLAEPSNLERLRDRPRKQLTTASADASQLGIITAADCCWKLWLYTGRQGASEILDGHESGWATLSQALALGRTYIAVFAQTWDAGVQKSSVVMASSAAVMLAHALAIGDDPTADFLAQRLVESVTRGMFGRSWFERSPFCTFIVRLHARLRGHRVELPSPEPRAYDAIWASWDSGGAALADALVAACEHHLASVNDTDAWTAEFAESAFPVFPAEILAVARVRQRLGLTTPPVAHPLMETALAQLPASVPPARNDETLDRVLDKARERWGDTPNLNLRG